jgi:hypothetical protein
MNRVTLFVQIYYFYVCFTVLKCKMDLSYHNYKILLNMNATYKRKCVSALYTSNRQNSMMQFCTV